MKMNKLADDCNCCRERPLSGLYCCFWKPFFFGRLHRHLCLPGIILNSFVLEAVENGVAPE